VAASVMLVVDIESLSHSHLTLGGSAPQSRARIRGPIPDGTGRASSARHF
jgi:hypothetical protein